MNKIKNKKQIEPSLYWSVRFLFSIVMAVCYIVVYLFRSNMSLAIVCMVNSTALLEIENITATSSEMSYRSNQTTTTKVIRWLFLSLKKFQNQIMILAVIQDGKFIWSKADQGLILSAYFYGYLLTQVSISISKSFSLIRCLAIKKTYCESSQDHRWMVCFEIWRHTHYRGVDTSCIDIVHVDNAFCQSRLDFGCFYSEIFDWFHSCEFLRLLVSRQFLMKLFFFFMFLKISRDLLFQRSFTFL